jgi:histidinol-phosphate aminotransferase
MKHWFSEKLDKLSKVDSYNRPERVKGTIKLDSNENLALDKKFITEIALQAAKYVDLREYPLEQLEELYRELSTYTGINKKNLAVGNGSDQLIELILSIIGKGQRATIFSPTFSYFMNRCELHEVTLDKIPLNKEDNSLHKVEFLQSAKQSNIAYICSPNNPTGNQFDRQSILEIIDSLDDKLILLDEAYVEFADYSLASVASKYDNVIILRTLSKAFGLAGARVGYFIANERFTQIFRSSIQSPYPLNTLSLTIARLVLSQFNYVKNTIEMVKQERKRVFDRLAKMNGIKAYKSNANFIFFESYEKYHGILRSLEKERLAIKTFGDIDGRKGCIRVTIGTTDMNDKFLKSIEEAV